MSIKEDKKFWISFVIGFLAYSSIYIARLNFSVASVAFEAETILNKAQIGVIGSIFSFVYALSKVPNGILGDLFSAKKIMILGLALTGTANLLIGLFPSYLPIAVLWGINAFGQSMLWGPLLRIMRYNNDDAHFTIASQNLSTSIAFGGIAGLIIAMVCLSNFGITACFVVPAIITLSFAVLVYFKFNDAPGKKQKNRIIGNSAVIIKNKDFYQMVLPAISHGMIKDNINIWLAIYFVDTYGINLKTAGWYVFFIPLMSLIGKMAFPVLYRKIRNEYIISIGAFILCAAGSACLMSKKLSLVMAVFFMGALAALAAIINTHFLAVLPGKIADKSNLSFTASIMDLLTYGGAGLGSLIFGYTIQKNGYGSMFFIWTIFSLISAVVLFAVEFRRR